MIKPGGSRPLVIEARSMSSGLVEVFSMRSLNPFYKLTLGGSPPRHLAHFVSAVDKIREKRGGDSYCCHARRSSRQPGATRRPAGCQIATARCRRTCRRYRSGADPQGSSNGAAGTEENGPRSLRRLQPEQCVALVGGFERSTRSRTDARFRFLP